MKGIFHFIGAQEELPSFFFSDRWLILSFLPLASHNHSLIVTLKGDLRILFWCRLVGQASLAPFELA